MTTKILLDTDIGSDVDDAICLALLLAHSECDLLGITTVTGQADRRAALASAVCCAAGRTVPIFPGAERPLLAPIEQTHAPQAEVLGRWPHTSSFPRGQAVEFLRHTIRNNPNEIVLLTIGPMTNIALLFAADPGIPSLLKGLTQMCGQFLRPAGSGRRETNARLDPHASAIAFNSDVRLHRAVGLDVTSRVTMSAAEARRQFSPPGWGPVLDCAEVWFRDHDAITFHDPLAAATIFDPEVCGFERGTVEVEHADPARWGETRWTPDPVHGQHEIAASVDVERFFGILFAAFD